MVKSSQNVLLASALALLSYIPFEIVAKTTLIVCAVLFITDPFPPTSRLVSLLAVVMVGFLARVEKSVQAMKHKDEQEPPQNVTDCATDQGVNRKPNDDDDDSMTGGGKKDR